MFPFLSLFTASRIRKSYLIRTKNPNLCNLRNLRTVSSHRHLDMHIPGTVDIDQRAMCCGKVQYTQVLYCFRNPIISLVISTNSSRKASWP